MDVHQVIDDPALDMPLVLVHDDLLSGIEYLEEAEVGFQVLVERLVLLFVVFDPRFEIFDHLRYCLVVPSLLSIIDKPCILLHIGKGRL